MKIFASLPIALALMLATSATDGFAGWQIDQTVKGERETGRQQVFVQANRMKMVTLGADGRPISAAILDLNADTVTHIEYGRRRYMTMTTQELLQGMRDAREVMASGAAAEAMKEHMKNLPPDQRRMVEEALRQRGGSTSADASCAPTKVEVRTTRQQATIAGFPAVRHELLVNGAVDSEVWTARDITAWRELDRQKVAALMQSMAELGPQCGASQGSSMFHHTAAAWKLETEGYPVRMTRGRETSVEVRKAEQRLIRDLEFQTPAGFTKMTLDGMRAPSAR